MPEESSSILAGLSPDLLVQIPPHAASQTALKLVAETFADAPALLNHSLRVYLLAKWLATKEGLIYADEEHLPLLFAACICHDLGASDRYNGRQRFEVEGADAALAHCTSHGMSKEDCHKVWCAIALHTSAGIAERIDPFTRLVRMGVKLDFSQAVRDAFNATIYASEIELVLPRLNIEKVLADAVVRQATKISERVDSMTWPDSEKHPKASWPGMLLRAHLQNPNFDGVNPAF